MDGNFLALTLLKFPIDSFQLHILLSLQRLLGLSQRCHHWLLLVYTPLLEIEVNVSYRIKHKNESLALALLFDIDFSVPKESPWEKSRTLSESLICDFCLFCRVALN